MSWTDRIDKWLDGLVRVSVSGDMNLKTNPNINDIINYKRPIRWTSGATLSNSANFLNALMPPPSDVYRIVTDVTVYNNNRAAFPHVWLYLFDGTQGLIPLAEGVEARAAGVYGDALGNTHRPLILPPGCSMQIRDNAYQAGDTCYYSALYYEVGL